MQRRQIFILAAILFMILAASILAGVWFIRPAAGPPESPGTGVRYGLDETLPPPAYYTGIDFDTLRPDGNLTMIPLKSFQQQVTDYTCGPASAMTVMSYYGVPVERGDAEELRLALEMNTSPDVGTNPVQIATWFNHHGWNATWGTNGTREMLLSDLKAGIPTMVEWVIWGGHWVTVVGYDTRGTESVWDDVIIFADSSDCADDRVDGITYFNYGEFDAMWFDAHYFPEEMRNRAWVVAVPGPGSRATIRST